MNRILQFVNYNNVNSFGSKLRKKRFNSIFVLMDSIFATKGSIRIIDLGGTTTYWSIVGLDYISKRYPGIHITLVNSEAKEQPENMSSVVSVVAGDACALSQFEDNSFDMVHSNSTIEHVGSWDRMKCFAREVRRLAPVYYVQTPYFWFPVEPHFLTPFFHWLPDSLRTKIISHTGLGHIKKAKNQDDAMKILGNYRLLDKAQFSFLFPDSKIKYERFLGIPKSLIAVK